MIGLRFALAYFFLDIPPFPVSNQPRFSDCPQRASNV